MSNDVEILRIRIADIKSRITSLSTAIETRLEIILADYFTNSFEDYQLFCHLFYPFDIELTFGKKIKIFEKFLNKVYPEYLKQNPDFINSLIRVKKIRNKFAHSINPKKSDLEKVIDKSYFILFYMEDGLPKEEEIPWKYIEERFEDFKSIEGEAIKIYDHVKPEKKSASQDSTQQDSEQRS